MRAATSTESGSTSDGVAVRDRSDDSTAPALRSDTALAPAPTVRSSIRRARMR